MRIIYNSFEGRFSDNPRSLYEALVARGTGDRHIWLLDPAHADTFPPDVETVVYGSAEAVRALEDADALIANTHTDFEWNKRPGTVYLQTWHGTPLKRIHWDVLWAPAGRLERLSKDVARWDYLVSPNRASTPFLRQAFRFEGEIVETGYPRNDALLAADRKTVRAAVRRALDIPDGMTAVLYTPTWRDDAVFAEGGKAFSLGLDPDALADQLGDDHCVLLRVHYMLTGRLEPSTHPRVREVSAYPDIADLYLAADVLVTDYSSTMFDFAVTGKPLVFYAYDLEDYADRLRGFYFDLAPLAPGPIVATQDALAAALRDLRGVRSAYADRYGAFRERFCHLEDGHAADRVLDLLPVADPAGA